MTAPTLTSAAVFSAMLRVSVVSANVGALLVDVVVVLPLMRSNCDRTFLSVKLSVLLALRRHRSSSILQPAAGVASSLVEAVVIHCTLVPTLSTTIKYRVDALSVVLPGAVKV